MNTHEEYVTYAQAKALKELGFDWPCRHYATKRAAPEEHYWNCTPESPICNSMILDCEVAVPTQSVACRWLREEKGLHVNIDMINDRYNASIWGIEKGVYLWCDEEDTPTYESALSAGIDRALELLKGGEV